MDLRRLGVGDICVYSVRKIAYHLRVHLASRDRVTIT